MTNKVQMGNNRKLSGRRGFSLIEIMAAMTMGALVFAVVVGWIHLTLGQASKTRRWQNEHRSLMSLSRQFRIDLRTADSIAMTSDSELLVQQGVDKILYAIDSDRKTLHRMIEQDAEKRIVESYQLETNLEFRWDTTEMPNWIHLRVVRLTGFPLPDKAVETNLLTDLLIRSGPAHDVGRDSRLNDDDEREGNDDE